MSVTPLAFDSVKRTAWPGGSFALTRRQVDGAAEDQLRCDDVTVIADLGCAGALTRGLRIADASYRGPFTPRQLHCVPARSEVEQRFDGRARCAYATLTLDARLMALAAERVSRIASTEIVPRARIVDPCLLRLVRLMYRELRGNELASALVLESVAMIAAVYLVRRHTGAELLPARESARLDQRRMARVTDYVDANLGQTITIADLAALVHLSRYHFCRCFKASMGVTPHGYITQRRLERAKRLLIHTSVGISQVAQDVGLCSHSHLSHLFRRSLGVTPAQFRSAARGQA